MLMCNEERTLLLFKILKYLFIKISNGKKYVLIDSTVDMVFIKLQK